MQPYRMSIGTFGTLVAVAGLLVLMMRRHGAHIRFGQMLRRNIFIARQIRDTAGNFEKQNEWLPKPQTPCAIETSTIWAEAQRVLCNH